MSGSEPILTRDSNAGASDRPRLVCVSTDADAAAVLQHVVQAIFPAADVGSADTGILRDPPDAECVILSVGAMYASAEPLARGLRARGFRKALVVVADIPAALESEQLTLLGIGEVVATRDLAISLPFALSRQLDLQDAARRSPLAGRLLDSARELQALVAAGQAAGGLKHRLNNPLAALLAEAQLMELETMPTEHSQSVHRIVELCRRVIDVTGTIDGLGR
jgi:signal transduction histidine kinase